ncbi:MAG: type VI secretion system ATPase TssH, partial [Alloprevotella sp.]|nr:type VI secretion system ATPase TssH [Alloprevotella sp.]
MNFERFTIKAQEAVREAVTLATTHGSQAVTPIHLLLGVLRAGGEAAEFLLSNAGADAATLQRAAMTEIGRQPRVSGSGAEPYLDREAEAVLNKANQLSQQQGDSYTGIEAVLLALLLVASSAQKMLRDAGVTEQALREATTKLRGGRKADSPTSEDTYQSLSRFARDLVGEAREGKLDPVIGRDDEIRRVLQILSRRTKNNP